jgi:hypothetical protein
VLVVLTTEPTSFVDAYALVKALTMRHGCSRYAILTNRSPATRTARAVQAVRGVVEQFLPVHLDHLGSIPEDNYLRDAVYAKRCCVEAFPSAPASAGFARLARRLEGLELPACRAASASSDWRRTMALIDPVQTYTRQPRPRPETLVRSHMQLVRKIAWHVHGRVASAIEIEDLVQIGMIAWSRRQRYRGSRPRLCDLRHRADPRHDDRSSAQDRVHLPLGHGAAARDECGARAAAGRLGARPTDAEMAQEMG